MICSNWDVTRVNIYRHICYWTLKKIKVYSYFCKWLVQSNFKVLHSFMLVALLTSAISFSGNLFCSWSRTLPPPGGIQCTVDNVSSYLHSMIPTEFCGKWMLWQISAQSSWYILIPMPSQRNPDFLLIEKWMRKKDCLLLSCWLLWGSLLPVRISLPASWSHWFFHWTKEGLR